MKAKQLMIFALLVSVVAATAIGQTGGTRPTRSLTPTYELRINANVPNARVFINAVEQPGTAPMSISLARGRYQVTVRAAGHDDFTTVVDLQRDLTVNARLLSRTVVLSVTSNVQSSTVFINSAARGDTPLRLELQPGRYSLRVEAPNHETYAEVIEIDSDITVNARLIPNVYQLMVTSNVRNATISINNQTRGNPPVRVDLKPGQYTIRVTAENYEPFVDTIQLSSNTAVNAVLQPSTAKVRFSFPQTYLNRSVRDPLRLIDIYVDGQRQAQHEFTVRAGRRLIRIETGGVAVETMMVFEAGRSYIVEPGLTINQHRQQ